jgi:hypothetical protein
MNKGIATLSGVLLVAWSGFAFGQDLMVFPADGQDAEQQGQDEYTCYGWAKGQSGFDPMALPTASEPPPQQEAKKGGAVRGAAGGAAVGAIVGDSDSAKKGAAAGAVVGGARRNRQNQQQAQKNANWEQEQSQQYAAGRNNYNRAYGACLEGKGYTVK